MVGTRVRVRFRVKVRTGVRVRIGVGLELGLRLWLGLELCLELGLVLGLGLGVGLVLGAPWKAAVPSICLCIHHPLGQKEGIPVGPGAPCIAVGWRQEVSSQMWCNIRVGTHKHFHRSGPSAPA